MFDLSNQKPQSAGPRAKLSDQSQVDRQPLLRISVGHWPNLKNLSDGLNLSRGLNMVGST